MANMIAKHGNVPYQCSCCDKGGLARRKGKKAAKAKEARAWKAEVRRGDA